MSLARSLLLVAAAVIIAVPAYAQPSMDVSYGPPVFNCINIETDSFYDCGDIIPNHPAPGASSYQLTVVLGRIGGDGATGVQFGIDYASTGQTAFLFSTQNTCQGSYQAISIAGPNGNWPNSGAGIAVTFGGACVIPASLGGFIPAYYFVVFGPSPLVGFLDLIPDPVGGFIGMTDCNNFTRDIGPAARGAFDFGGQSGSQGCQGAIPTEAASWSEVKAHF